MRIELRINKKWSSASMARHLYDISLLYRWENIKILDDIAEERQPWARDFIFRYLYGNSVSPDLVRDEPDLLLHSIHYGSPTIEGFEGTVRGLNGLAGLIERLIFFKHTKALKDLEFEERKAKLAQQKIDLINCAHDLMEKIGTSRDQASLAVRRYVGAIDGLNDLVKYGQLEEFSVIKIATDLSNISVENENEISPQIFKADDQ